MCTHAGYPKQPPCPCLLPLASHPASFVNTHMLPFGIAARYSKHFAGWSPRLKQTPRKMLYMPDEKKMGEREEDMCVRLWQRWGGKLLPHLLPGCRFWVYFKYHLTHLTLILQQRWHFIFRCRLVYLFCIFIGHVLWIGMGQLLALQIGHTRGDSQQSTAHSVPPVCALACGYACVWVWGCVRVCVCH